nr:10605_t:CDS:2 [Entrophospora candida]
MSSSDSESSYGPKVKNLKEQLRKLRNDRIQEFNTAEQLIAAGSPTTVDLNRDYFKAAYKAEKAVHNNGDAGEVIDRIVEAKKAEKKANVYFNHKSKGNEMKALGDINKTAKKLATIDYNIYSTNEELRKQQELQSKRSKT